MCVVTTLLPALPQVRFELADMTKPADNRLALRKLPGPEPSPNGFDRNVECLADTTLAMSIGMQGDHFLIAFQSALSTLLLPTFFGSDVVLRPIN
jgi:hypothetical protein